MFRLVSHRRCVCEWTRQKSTACTGTRSYQVRSAAESLDGTSTMSDNANKEQASHASSSPPSISRQVKLGSVPSEHGICTATRTRRQVPHPVQQSRTLNLEQEGIGGRRQDGENKSKQRQNDRPDEGSPVSATGAAGTEPPTSHSVPHSSLSCALVCVLSRHCRDNMTCVFASSKLFSSCQAILVHQQWHGMAPRRAAPLRAAESALGRDRLCERCGACGPPLRA
ncbi:hypothetical protein V8C42DRAFT_277968 [Trichoderma barbatum]